MDMQGMYVDHLEVPNRDSSAGYIFDPCSSYSAG
jgi:hypothetical protein